MQKIIRVNMDNLTVTREDEPVEYECLGGRGLTSKIINQEVPPN